MGTRLGTRPRGRPRTGNAGLPHRPRPRVSSAHPHHVTVRFRRGTWNLRAQRTYRELLESFRHLRRSRLDFRITHFSVQGNHVHLLAEASDRKAMTNGVRALLISMARRLNRLMRKSGSRFQDRYHESVLTTPSAVRRCLRYVLENHARHMAKIGKIGPVLDPYSSAPWFDGYHPEVLLLRATGDPPVSTARSTLLSTSWRRLGLLPTAADPNAPRAATFSP